MRMTKKRLRRVPVCFSLKHSVAAKVAAEAQRTGKSRSRVAEEMLESAEPHVMVEEVRCRCGTVLGKKRTSIPEMERLRMMHPKEGTRIDEALEADFRCRDCGTTVRQ
jgi:rubrerythrin